MSDLISREDAVEAIYEALRTPLPNYNNDFFHDSMSLAIAMAKNIPSAEPEQKIGECTKINCPIQMNYILNDCDIKTCPYRTERKIGKWENIALFTRECSECGAQFHELEYDNYCPNCGVKMEWNE